MLRQLSKNNLKTMGGEILFGGTIGFAGVLYGWLRFQRMMSEEIRPEKEIDSASRSLVEKMQHLSQAIQDGAQTYLVRQAITIGYVGLPLTLGIGWLLGWRSALGFLTGALLSGWCGFFGMQLSVRANVRTTQAARTGLIPAFRKAFDAGAAIGFYIIGVALLGLSIVAGALLYIYHDTQMTHVMRPLIALSLGASLISMFARLGGGIFTKGADVGADLAGKLEQGLPEDDPRNPAVIADNVGDNVGDCAGMAADLFETYVVTMIAGMQISLLLNNISSIASHAFFLYPLVLGAAGLLASWIGSFFVRLSSEMADSKAIMGALYRGLWMTLLISAGLVFVITQRFFGLNDNLVQTGEMTGWGLIFSGWIGLAVTAAMVWIANYYTATHHKPVQRVAYASRKGPASNLIEGLALSMESCALPIIVIAAGILLCYQYAGLFGIAIGGVSMLSVAGMIVALDAYGPITDNAGGIAEMSGAGPGIRAITDKLDAVGNTTKAVTKGYAVGSAGLAALVLFTAYTEDVHAFAKLPAQIVDRLFSLDNPFVVIGLLIGAIIPYLFGAMSMKAVSQASQSVIEEAQRQFPGIIAGTRKPDYAAAVDLLTKAALKLMVIPSLLPVLIPIGLFMGLKTISVQAALSGLGGLLMGILIAGLFLAISMTTGGGAWDNVKKFIEMNPNQDPAYSKKDDQGQLKEAYKSAVVGDTVGDPYKDTAGPAMNPLIKIANIVALLILAVTF